MSKPATFAPDSKTDFSEYWDDGLRKISNFILTERRNLIPHPHILPQDTERMDRLWREHSRKGDLMSIGGVEDSFVKGKQTQKSTTEGFSGYRTDITESVVFSPQELKKFLTEENIISPDSNLDQLFIEIALGSHEGLTRVINSIHDDRSNNGVLYPIGGYSLIARAIATTQHPSYKIHLVNVDRDNGEKILISDLREVARNHPSAKTLYVDSKTMCGAVYNQEELTEIVRFCKESGTFLILDTAHANMEFDPANKFPSITKIAQDQDYKDFAVIFTGSKTYGLERARFGLIMFGDEQLAKKARNNLGKAVGSLSDQPFEVGKALMSSSLEERAEFIAQNKEKHRLNMNLLIGYIEGVASPNIDEDARGFVMQKIPAEYQEGIKGIRLNYKPQSGIQLKIDMSELQNKFFGNIRMFNSEIFSYTLHAATDVVTLHSYQVMDPQGFSMRLSFSIEENIHNGMRKMHDFVSHGLLDHPQINKYMPGIDLAENFIFPSKQEMEQEALISRQQSININHEELLSKHKENAKSGLSRYSPKLSSSSREKLDEVLDEVLNNSARVIQNAQRKRKISESDLDEKKLASFSASNDTTYTDEESPGKTISSPSAAAAQTSQKKR